MPQAPERVTVSECSLAGACYTLFLHLTLLRQELCKGSTWLVSEAWLQPPPWVSKPLDWNPVSAMALAAGGALLNCVAWKMCRCSNTASAGRRSWRTSAAWQHTSRCQSCTFV